MTLRPNPGPAPTAATTPPPAAGPHPWPGDEPTRRQRLAKKWSYRAFVALGAIGRTMITVGVLLALFVGYQLWGTSWHESRAQRSLARDFDALLASATISTPSTTTASTTTAARPTPTVAPTTTEAAAPELLAAFDSGDAVARIRIPKIEVDKVVVEGVSVDDLRKGPGHYKSTPLPGQKGNAAIAGHRTTYGAPFNRIDELEPGDEIQVTTPQGQFTYVVLPQTDPRDGTVSGHLIVDPSDVWVLDDVGDNRLTLTACHPKLSARNRIVVQARLLEPPAPTPQIERPADDTSGVDPAVEDPAPRDIAADLDQGLGGDRSELTPSIAWGSLLAVVFLATAYGTRRWGRLRSWGAAAAPLCLVVFVFFEHLDRLLPAR